MDDFIFALGLGFVGFLLFVFIGMGVAYRMDLPGSLARIEQLRADVQKVGAVSNEDVIGQATKWNQAIRSNQAYNRTWYAALLVPNAWDDVELIEIPRQYIIPQ